MGLVKMQIILLLVLTHIIFLIISTWIIICFFMLCLPITIAYTWSSLMVHCANLTGLENLKETFKDLDNLE